MLLRALWYQIWEARVDARTPESLAHRSQCGPLRALFRWGGARLRRAAPLRASLCLSYSYSYSARRAVLVLDPKPYPATTDAHWFE